MPINVVHAPNSALVGALDYLAAQQAEQERRRREEQALAFQQMQFDAQLGQNAGRDQLQRDLAGDQLAQRERESHRNYALQFMRGGGYGGGRGGGAGGGGDSSSIINNLIDGQQAMDLEGLRGQQQLAQDAMGDQNMMARAAMTQDAQLRNKYADAIDPDVQDGLRRGFLSYSPEQKTERQQLVDSINKARGNPALTPQQRMMFEAQQYQRINEIDNSPEPVSPDQWPKSLNEMFDEETTLVDIGGRQVRVSRGERNGVPTWNTIEPPKDDTAKMEFEREKNEQSIQEFNRRMEEMDQNQAITERKNAIDVDKSFFNSELDMLNQRREAALDALRDDKPVREDFETPGSEPGKTQFNRAGYAAAVAEHQKKLGAIRTEFQPEYDDLKKRYGQPVQSGTQQSAIASPDELASKIQSGELKVGDTVQTPKGPKVLTPEVIARLMGQ